MMDPPDKDPRPVEVSVVIPCLNEADTLKRVIQKAFQVMEEQGIIGEIVVADNGSSDGSPDIARQLGARVIQITEPGYGSALMGGIEAAQGRFIIMGDADDSYNFLDLSGFVTRLRQGYELVQGCRLPSGGGQVMPGAMPFLHRWIGNPLFTRMVQWWFHAPVHDVYCGLRGFTKALYERLDLRCTGMEFATEMIIKASLHQAKITEVPVTLYPDGRSTHAPHLKTIRDGWRTLRFFLLLSPRWLFLMPGLLLILAGLAGYIVAFPGLGIGRIRFDAHTLLFASLAILCGYQAILFAVFARTFAATEGLLPPQRSLRRLFEVLNLERGLVFALLGLICGGLLLIMAINQWRLAEFGRLDYARTMRLVIPGATLFALGFQTALSSFFISILGMRRK